MFGIAQSCSITHIFLPSNLSDLSLWKFHHEPTSLSAAPSSAVTSTKGRSKTGLPRRKRKGKDKKTGPLSEQEVAEHVAALYIHGPGGILRDSERRRQRRQSELDRTLPPLDRQDAHQQLQSLRKLDRHPALLLNADYQPMSWLPLSLWNWQEAVKAVFSGKVTVVDVYPDVSIRAANLEVPLPSVIALTEYVPQHHQPPAFTKRNVFLRDEYRCQYCQNRFHTRDLSLDHVVPRCKGGRLNWENAVTSCRACNGRKGSLDLADIKSVGMRLKRTPRVPTQYELAATASRMLPRRVHPTWEPYLGIVSSSSTIHTGQSKSIDRTTSSHGKARALEEEV
jgi:5-methylcytosine-specific restriction endonuclease McrA